MDIEHKALVRRLRKIYPTGHTKRAADTIESLSSEVQEAKRRLLHLATSNSDDWKWYKQQAQQACRALGIEAKQLDFDEAPETKNG